MKRDLTKLSNALSGGGDSGAHSRSRMKESLEEEVHNFYPRGTVNNS